MGQDESHCTVWYSDNVISKLLFVVVSHEQEATDAEKSHSRILVGSVLTAKKKPRYCLSISKKLITLIGNKRGI
jgi:hypothetical protein